METILKYADDSYLLIPSSNATTVVEELDHVGKWAEICYLNLNQDKTYEMLIRQGGVGWGSPLSYQRYLE